MGFKPEGSGSGVGKKVLGVGGALVLSGAVALSVTATVLANKANDSNKDPNNSSSSFLTGTTSFTTLSEFNNVITQVINESLKKSHIAGEVAQATLTNIEYLPDQRGNVNLYFLLDFVELENTNSTPDHLSTSYQGNYDGTALIQCGSVKEMEGVDTNDVKAMLTVVMNNGIDNAMIYMSKNNSDVLSKLQTLVNKSVNIFNTPSKEGYTVRQSKIFGYNIFDDVDKYIVEIQTYVNSTNNEKNELNEIVTVSFSVSKENCKTTEDIDALLLTEKIPDSVFGHLKNLSVSYSPAVANGAVAKTVWTPGSLNPYLFSVEEPQPGQ